MKVTDLGIWPEQIPENLREESAPAWSTLLTIRRRTYQDFAALESSRGFLTPQISLDSTKGQEMVRILLLRGIEELMEAVDSLTTEHYLEEHIDALNFFMVVSIIDPSIEVDDPALSHSFHRGWMESSAMMKREYLSRDHHRDFVWTILLSMNGILQKLRNRPWQQNTQSTYFDGLGALSNFNRVLGLSMSMLFRGSWDDFVHYFLAKDNVLQFRLRTKY